MKILLLLITGGLVGFLLCFSWKSAPRAEGWHANRAHFERGERPKDGVSGTGIRSGQEGIAFVGDEDDDRRVLIRVYPVAHGVVHLSIAQWRPFGKNMPAPVELDNDVRQRVGVELPTLSETFRTRYQDADWELSLDVYRLTGERDIILTGDDFINLPPRVYFDESLYGGMTVPLAAR